MLQGADIYWPLYCPITQAYINNKVHSVTKSTPFSLMFARLFNFPLSTPTHSSNPSTPNLDMDHDLQQWQDYQTRINLIVYPEIAEIIKSNKEKMIRSVDKRHRLLKDNHFVQGSVVMLKD
jgi:hypothetical protein